MITHLDTVAAPASSVAIVSVEPDFLYLDPDVAALFAEVDAILCAAPPAGCALVGSRSAGRSCGALVGPRRGPVQPVWAVQRGPPTRDSPRPRSTTPCERQVMASQQT
jgi:hypothetical protein